MSTTSSPSVSAPFVLLVLALLSCSGSWSSLRLLSAAALPLIVNLTVYADPLCMIPVPGLSLSSFVLTDDRQPCYNSSAATT